MDKKEKELLEICEKAVAWSAGCGNNNVQVMVSDYADEVIVKVVVDLKEKGFAAKFLSVTIAGKVQKYIDIQW